MQTRPDISLLEMYLPASIWKMAEAQAERSMNRNFQTGAVIFNAKSGKALSRGCAHPDYHFASSIHAEDHALRRLSPKEEGANLTCLIVTLSAAGNWSYTSRPCALCAHKLHRRGISHVMYAERDNDGVWLVNYENVSGLVERSSVKAPCYGLTARNMRIG